MKSRSKQLLDRAVAATIAAIEIYNKPDFPYRAETFCILAVNGWELLLKAKWLKENGNRIQSLYEKEYRTNIDGSKSKRKTIKLSSAGIPFTHGLGYLAKRLVEQNHLDPMAKGNLDLLVEQRNTSVHFFHQSEPILAKSLQEIGTASTKNFLLATKDWFDRDLSDYNFYLMPLSFVDLPRQTEAIVLNREERSFLKYLDDLAAQTDESFSDYRVTAYIDVKLTRSNAEGVQEVRRSNNPNAEEIRMTDDQFRDTYPWTYSELTNRCRKRYRDFKANSMYHGIRKPLERDSKFCWEHRLDSRNPKSTKRNFYSPNILQEFDGHYLKVTT